MASKEFEEFEESGYLLDEGLSKHFTKSAKNPDSKTPWLLVSFISAVALASLCLNIWQWSHHTTARQTDLPDARGAIQYEQRRFTGALVYDEESKTAIRVKDAPVVE